MRRLLLTILLFLVLGAVVNVAVAWGCAAKGGLTPLKRKYLMRWSDPRNVEGWGVMVDYYRSLGMDRAVVMRLRLVQMTPLRSAPDSEPDPMWLRQSITDAVVELDWGIGRVDASGLPLRSMMCRWPWSTQAREAHEVEGIIVSRPQNLHFEKGRALPLRILWMGFAIDTLLYAVLLWLSVCGPFALRRYIRKRRGRCLKCGYPEGASPTCTECGSVL